MEELGELESRMYKYLRKVICENGYSPSVRDIKAALGIRSTATVFAYLEKLEQKGYIQKEQGKSRTLRLGDSAPGVSQRAVSVPVLGSVAAGLPILAEENFEGYIDFCPTGRTDGEELFALGVRGESMIDIGIMDGDYVIVSRTEYVDNGQVAVVLIGDEATVKTFYKENGVYRLQPENKTMKAIIAKNVRVLGKVIASVRFYN